MNQKEFSISGVLQEGWELTKVNIGFLFVYQIIFYLLAILFGLTQGPGWKLALWQIFGFIIVVLAKMGLYKSILLLTTGNKPSFDQFYQNWPNFASWVIAGFLFGIMFVVGLILLIVPGCYILAKFGLFPFFILDKNLGPLEALKEAGKASQERLWPIFLLFITCFAINLLGLLFFGIGLLITVPVTLIALATVYRHITGQDKNSIQPEDIE